jgi:hypothetical protein
MLVGTVYTHPHFQDHYAVRLNFPKFSSIMTKVSVSQEKDDIIMTSLRLIILYTAVYPNLQLPI